LDYFNYKNGEAFCEDVSLTSLASQYDTPLYVYSKATLLRHCKNLLDAFKDYPTLACFAVKANSNISYLSEIFKCGFGADIVSIGELERALNAGCDPKKIVYSGVGKKPEDLEQALNRGILSFNVESAFELDLVEQIAAKKNVAANISLRINPNIDAKTNPKISTGLNTTKFGLSENIIEAMLIDIKKRQHLRLTGLACHIGSQMIGLGPVKAAAQRLVFWAKKALALGLPLENIDMGGGLGIRYDSENPPELADYARTLICEVKPTNLKLLIEPGRVIAGNTGVLLSKVIGVKATPEKNFLVIDAAMTELLRPAMYAAFHDILPVKAARIGKKNSRTFDVVGPVCETSDLLGEGRSFENPAAGDLVYVRGAGAYGFSMSSNYNTRPRVAEVMVDGSKATLIRRREKLADLWREEIF
jgi:diaminopimelate decarboxylase